jgi:peptidoglycan/xylan/chitin deacetylase (PgdA/CDA1 family)
MYHYVRPVPTQLDYFRYLHVDDFRRQLDWFTAHYTFIERDAFLRSLREGRACEGVVLTFDDGLSDHYRYVVPELTKRGLWGIFYVPTGMYTKGKLLDVHRIHLLLGRFGGETALELLQDILTEEMMSHHHVKDFHEATYGSQRNDPATNSFKRILNFFISYEWRERVLDRLMERFLADGNERNLVDEFYMTAPQIRVIHDAGMLVGSHGVSHLVMSKLGLKEQEREIADSFAFLEEATGSRPITFCYPHGGFHTFTRETEQLLTTHGALFSFNVEARDATVDDVRLRPQALPRHDCNKFPFGTASFGPKRPVSPQPAAGHELE